jgi:hypothetical protein
MYNLVWQSVMCRPGKLLILLVTKNQMLRPTAPTSAPPGENAPPGMGWLQSGYALPPSPHPRSLSHPRVVRAKPSASAGERSSCGRLDAGAAGAQVPE